MDRLEQEQEHDWHLNRNAAVAVQIDADLAGLGVVAMQYQGRCSVGVA